MVVAAGTHWAAILTTLFVGLTAFIGGAWAIVRQILRWREENAKAMGTLAGLIGDWCDEVDDHLSDQDHTISIAASRLRDVEKATGLKQGAPYAPPRRRSRPRRIEAVEAGFDVSPIPPATEDDESLGRKLFYSARRTPRGPA